MVQIVKAIVFPVVMYRCKSWMIKKAEHQRTDAFKLWCWRRILRVPWTARKSNQSILREISPEYSLAGLMLKLTPVLQPPDSKLLFSRSLVFDSLWPHGLQHARLLYPSPSPGACSDSSPSSWWCHPTISSSCISFSFCLQSFPASGSFLLSQFFTSGGQSFGVFSFSISPSDEYSGLISFRMDFLFVLLTCPLTT